VVPKKLVKSVKMMLQDSLPKKGGGGGGRGKKGKKKKEIQGKLTAVFGIERGWRHGDSLSTALFNIVLGKVISNIETNPNGTIFNRTREYITYADDVLILGRLVIENEEIVTRSKEAAESTGLVINKSKTKFIKKQNYNKFRARSDNRQTSI